LLENRTKGDLREQGREHSSECVPNHGWGLTSSVRPSAENQQILGGLADLAGGQGLGHRASIQACPA